VVDAALIQAGRQRRSNSAARPRAGDRSGRTGIGDFDVGQLKAFFKKHGYLA